MLERKWKHKVPEERRGAKAGSGSGNWHCGTAFLNLVSGSKPAILT